MVIQWAHSEPKNEIDTKFILPIPYPSAGGRNLLGDTLYGVTDLGSLGGGLSHGLATNEAGDVTGGSVTVSVYAKENGCAARCVGNSEDRRIAAGAGIVISLSR